MTILSEKLSDLKWEVRHQWRSLIRVIDHGLNPRQRWLTKKIPRHWQDKDSLIELVCFDGLIHFWEKDGGEESLRYQFESNEQTDCLSDEHKAKSQEVYSALKEAYDWAKIRDAEQEKIYDEYPCPEAPICSDVKEVREQRKEWAQTAHARELAILAKDDIHIANIVKYRKYMWT